MNYTHSVEDKSHSHSNRPVSCVRIGRKCSCRNSSRNENVLCLRNWSVSRKGMWFLIPWMPDNTIHYIEWEITSYDDTIQILMSWYQDDDYDTKECLVWFVSLGCNYYDANEMMTMRMTWNVCLPSISFQYLSTWKVTARFGFVWNHNSLTPFHWLGCSFLI